MGDYYTAEVTATFPKSMINFDSKGNVVTTDLFVVPEDDDHPVAVLATAWSECGFEDITILTHVDLIAVSDSIEVSATNYSASYGIMAFTDDANLDSALFGADVPFSMSDEGMYENPGQCVFWRAHMPAIETRTANQNGIVMQHNEAEVILREAEAIAEDKGENEAYRSLTARLRDHFDMEDNT